MARPSRFAGRGKRDANHKPIADAFTAHGWKVQDLSSVGGDCPDMLVLHPDGCELFLVEVKMPKGRLTPGQSSYAQVWPVEVIRTVDAAREFIIWQS